MTPKPSNDRVVIMRHKDSGAMFVWSDGAFSGDSHLATRARNLAEQRSIVQIDGIEFWADDRTPHGAAIAMIAACKGRAEQLTPVALTPAMYLKAS